MHLYPSTNDCLFASEKSPYERLSKNGIEAVIKTLGNKSGVDNAHPLDIEEHLLLIFSTKECQYRMLLVF